MIWIGPGRGWRGLYRDFFGVFARAICEMSATVSRRVRYERARTPTTDTNN
jgi:hypothetical protein